MTQADLFRSDDLRVKKALGYSYRCLVITFDAYSDAPWLKRAGFAEGFLRDSGIDALHFIERGNTWYQSASMPAACAAAAKVARDYKRVITYGMSMGAYAAIRYGRMAGAQAALALSPQFSIDRRVAPFEKRWAAEAGTIEFRHERDPEPFVETSIIVYDPRDDDRHQVALYRGLTDIVEVAITNAGHPASIHLSQAGLLKDCVLDAARGTFDADALRRRARAARKAVPHFAANLAGKARHPSHKLFLARRAAELAPEDAEYRMSLGRALLDCGDMAAARACMEDAAARQPANTRFQTYLSHFHERAGDLETAKAIMQRLCDRHPEDPSFVARRDELVRSMTEPAAEPTPSPA